MSVCPSVRLSVRMNAEILETISVRMNAEISETIGASPDERWDLGNYKS